MQEHQPRLKPKCMKIESEILTYLKFGMPYGTSRTARPEPSFKTTDIIELTPENPVKVYPVPANGLVNFEILVVETSQTKFLQITDAMGMLIEQLPLSNGFNKIAYSQSLANGLYFYSLIIGQKTIHTGKFSILK